MNYYKTFIVIGMPLLLWGCVTSKVIRDTSASRVSRGTHPFTAISDGNNSNETRDTYAFAPQEIHGYSMNYSMESERNIENFMNSKTDSETSAHGGRTKGQVVDETHQKIVDEMEKLEKKQSEHTVVQEVVNYFSNVETEMEQFVDELISAEEKDLDQSQEAKSIIIKKINAQKNKSELGSIAYGKEKLETSLTKLKGMGGDKELIDEMNTFSECVGIMLEILGSFTWDETTLTENTYNTWWNGKSKDFFRSNSESTGSA